MFVWSDQQNAIFSAGVRGSKHIIVFALAGTAKTTTAVELVDRYRNDPLTGHHSVLLCAYNNRIRDELTERIALQEKRSAVLGVHQAGFALLRGAFRGITLDEDKGKKCAARACIEAGYVDAKYIERADLQWRLRVHKLATLAKYTMAQTENDLIAITNRFELVDEKHPAAPMIEMVKNALRFAVTDTTCCDFDDQIWMPIQYNIHPRSPFDLVIGDECFIGDTPILLDKQGTTRTIRDLVKTKYSGTVVSFDGKRTVERRVVGWHETPVRGSLVKVVVQQRGFREDGTRISKNAERLKFGRRIVVCTPDHRFWTPDGDKPVSGLIVGDTVQVESIAPRDEHFNHKHKIGAAGRATLREEVRKKNADGRCGSSRVIQRRISVRGGNGRGPTMHETALRERLGDGWVTGHTIRTGSTSKRGELPTHFKIDVAHLERRIAIELDGASHNLKSRKEQDARKDAFLSSQGWQVIRLTNDESIRLTDDILAARIPRCPVEAEIISITPYEPKEPYVYDLTVEDTHHYYAHGVLVHNCQDWSTSELWIIQRMLAPNGRMILFGDPNQSVYDWKGADVDAMGRMKTVLESTQRGCDVLKLTTTYRCPKAVVREAAKIVREYTAATSAPEGTVRRTTVSKMVQDVQPGDVIISRLKAPLSSTCLALIRARKAAYVVGRDYGDLMLGLMDKSGATTPDELEQWAMSRAVTEYEKLMAQDQDEKASNVFDEYDTLCGLAKMSRSIAELRSTIDRLFRDKAPSNAVTCTTLHKAKGLEWDRVFLLAHTFKRDKPAEERILYVAMTRSKRELVYVWPDPKGPLRVEKPTIKPVYRTEAQWKAYYDIEFSRTAKEEE